MRQATVSIRDEDFAGSEEIISSFRDAEILDIQTLSCDWSGGVVRVRVKQEFDERQLDGADSVDWWEQVSDAEPGYVYLLEMSATEDPDPLTPTTDEVLPVDSLEVTDEGFTFDIAGSQDGIRTVLEGFEDADMTVMLEELHGYRNEEAPLHRLTERQREVLEVAYENGYYTVPRTATTEEVAAELDVDPSTVAEHLQRAERNLMSELFG